MTKNDRESDDAWIRRAVQRYVLDAKRPAPPPQAPPADRDTRDEDSVRRLQAAIEGARTRQRKAT